MALCQTMIFCLPWKHFCWLFPLHVKWHQLLGYCEFVYSNFTNMTPTSSRAALFWATLMSALIKFERSLSTTHFKIKECRLSDTHFLGWVKSKSALFKKASEFIKFKPISLFFFALRAKWYMIDILLCLVLLTGSKMFCASPKF